MYNLLLKLSLLVCISVPSLASTYREHLVLKPLPQSSLLAAFNFQSNTSISEFEQQNYNLFPRSLGQILLHTHTEELHLRFAFGRWDAESWGARPRGGRREGGTGVELWAWLEADDDALAESRWFTLTNALSGLFCASLNFVDRTKTIRPVSTFEREGDMAAGSLHLLHGALPHEVVCTENLTPFLKLMPCKGKAGISSLLDGHKLFDASWQTMAVDVRKTCKVASNDCQIEIEQTVDMVLGIDRSMRPTNDPIPRPPLLERIKCNTTKPYNSDDTCFPEDHHDEHAWDLKGIFGRPIRGSCPLGDASEIKGADIQIHVPPERTVSTPPAVQNLAPADQSVRVYSLPENVDVNISVAAFPTGKEVDVKKSVLSVDRTMTGYGQEHGGINTVLINHTPADLEVIYLESLPWFMKPYLHTLKAVVSSYSAIRSNASSLSSTDSAITNILYRPAQDRLRGTHLELTLLIPAHSTVSLGYYFEKAILRYTEYPPDANRGFDVAPAVIRILPPPMNQLFPQLGRRSAGQVVPAWNNQSLYIRTTSLLLPLPTPDFSMPYNVIILTSTVIAMGFGSIFNLLTRRFVAADEVDSPALAGLVREKIRGLIAKVKGAKGKALKEKGENEDVGNGEVMHGGKPPDIGSEGVSLTTGSDVKEYESVNDARARRSGKP